MAESWLKILCAWCRKMNAIGMAYRDELNVTAPRNANIVAFKSLDAKRQINTEHATTLNKSMANIITQTTKLLAVFFVMLDGSLAGSIHIQVITNFVAASGSIWNCPQFFFL